MNNLFFKPRKNSFIYKISDEEFTKIVQNSNCIGDITKQLGYKQRRCGQNTRDKIRERMKKLNLEIINNNIKYNRIKINEENVKFKVEKINYKNFKSIGIICEEAVKLNLLKKGINISVPIGDNAPYDLIADINNKLIKIQVKSAFLSKKNKDKICSHFKRSHISNNKIFKRFGYSEEEVDWFAIYCIETNDLCFIENKNNISGIILRHKNSITSYTKNNLIKDFSIDKFIEKVINQQ